jgi:hypothetical protein
MKRTRAIMRLGVALVFALTVGMSSVWANEPGYGKKDMEAADMGQWVDMARA